MKCEESFPVELAAPEEKGAKPAVLFLKVWKEL